MSTTQTASFPAHLTKNEMGSLKVGDKVDHRDQAGLSALATIIQNNGSHLQIHYDGWSSKWDTWNNDAWRFAKPHSISSRAIHRQEMQFLSINDYVDFNSKRHPGWKKAQIRRFDKKSAQIQVIYRDPDLDKFCLFWGHLDNKEEVDICGTHTNVQKSNTLQIWLQTKHSFKNTPNQIKSSCTKDIIQKVFGNDTDLMQFIIKNANTTQLKQIDDIIKQNNIKYKEIQNNKSKMNTMSSIIIAKLQDKPKISSITELSNNSITHICSYLTKYDVQRFKMTNYKNCMVCLKEMEKYPVGIFACNQLINNKNKKYIDLVQFPSTESMIINRYIPTTSCLYLSGIWENRYNISKEMQLLFAIGNNKLIFYEHNQLKDLLVKQMPLKNFYLLNKANIIYFDNITNIPKIMDNNDIICDGMELIFLKWFDVFFQQIIPLQFIIINTTNNTLAKILEYVENEFIATTNKQRKWYAKLLDYFMEINNNDAKLEVNVLGNDPSTIVSDEDKINIYSNRKPPMDIFCQLNTDNPWLKKSKFATLNEKIDLIW